MRHHGSEKEAEAYLFGWADFGPHRGAPRPPLRNADGVFTVMHRRHVPSGLPESLLVLRACHHGAAYDRDAVTAVGPDGAPVDERISECL